jgi:hypothetical protein
LSFSGARSACRSRIAISAVGAIPLRATASLKSSTAVVDRHEDVFASVRNRDFDRVLHQRPSSGNPYRLMRPAAISVAFLSLGVPATVTM